MSAAPARVVFIGSEEIGWASLRALLDAGANVVGVYALNEAAGRRVVAHRSFEPFAAEHVALNYGDGMLTAGDVATIRQLRPDLIYEVGWSQLLPPELLTIPALGTVGMHCSLLPKHRGRAPIPWSIIHGLTRSGMTLFYLTGDADRGDIVGQEAFAIGPHDTAADVYGKAVVAAVTLIGRYHPQLAGGVAPRIRQDPARSDYWPKRTPQDGLIDWEMSTARLYDWVRALTHPFPGAFTFWGDRKLLVWQARPESGTTAARAGAVLTASSAGILVGTGDGALAVTSLQIEGEDELDAATFLRRHTLSVSDVLG